MEYPTEFYTLPQRARFQKKSIITETPKYEKIETKPPTTTTKPTRLPKVQWVPIYASDLTARHIFGNVSKTVLKHRLRSTIGWGVTGVIALLWLTRPTAEWYRTKVLGQKD